MRLFSSLVLLALAAAPALAGARYCALGGGLAGVAGELDSFTIQSPFVLQAQPGEAVPIVDDGVSGPEARAKAAALLSRMLAQSPAALPASLRQGRVFLAIIPKDKKLTDLPQFKSLRGVRLPDGRTWDDIRGVGFVSQDDGTVAVGVGEENLLENAGPDGYPKGFLVAHEFSHAVHEYGLADADKAGVKSSYDLRKNGGEEFPSRYAKTNAYEYFAVSASAFFGRSLSGSDPERPIGWIETNDKPIFAVLGRTYGTPRPLWP